MAYLFADCSIDPERHALVRDNRSVHVEPQVFELLLALVEKRGRLVTKDELVERVWRGLSVSDATISARVNAARKAVGDTGREQAIIRTVHGLGFQMAAVVSQVLEPAAEAGLIGDAASRQIIRFARSSHDARIAFARSGDGPPLVRAGHWLSHLELDWHSSVWRPLIETLGRDHTLYRYDQRGTGLSSRDLDFADLDAFADDLKAVADANDLDRFPIFAASQAVPIAIRFAARHPERVSGLVLYGGFAVGRALRELAPGDIDEETILGLIRAGWGKADSPFISAFSSLFLPDATTEQMDGFVRMQTETITPENAARLRRIVDRFSVTDILAAISAPTLVIHANSDAVQPVEQGRILAGEIPNARYVSLESRNHVPLPQEESWARMMGEVRSFLFRIDS
jgi:pimeloyl-ACP methyl ester carboxylesterase/DNA-binding winged helix-turn-helix (wHTH) protein